jgi:uncharacterized protein
MIRANAIAAALSMAAITGLAQPAAAQDFNCAGARTTTERTICSSHSLKQLDEAMAELYGRIWGMYGRTPFKSADRLSLQSQQHEFLASRDSCGSSTRCIRGAYDDHIGQLTTWLRSARNQVNG